MRAPEICMIEDNDTEEIPESTRESRYVGRQIDSESSLNCILNIIWGGYGQ